MFCVAVVMKTSSKNSIRHISHDGILRFASSFPDSFEFFLASNPDHFVSLERREKVYASIYPLDLGGNFRRKRS